MNQKNKHIEGRVVTNRLLSFVIMGRVWRKCFWLKSNSNQAVQDIKDGLKFFLINDILSSWLVIADLGIRFCI